MCHFWLFWLGEQRHQDAGLVAGGVVLGHEAVEAQLEVAADARGATAGWSRRPRTSGRSPPGAVPQAGEPVGERPVFRVPVDGIGGVRVGLAPALIEITGVLVLVSSRRRRWACRRGTGSCQPRCAGGPCSWPPVPDRRRPAEMAMAANAIFNLRCISNCLLGANWLVDAFTGREEHTWIRGQGLAGGLRQGRRNPRGSGSMARALCSLVLAFGRLSAAPGPRHARTRSSSLDRRTGS